jgi:hypothetical protein
MEVPRSKPRNFDIVILDWMQGIHSRAESGWQMATRLRPSRIIHSLVDEVRSPQPRCELWNRGRELWNLSRAALHTGNQWVARFIPSTLESILLIQESNSSPNSL